MLQPLPAKAPTKPKPSSTIVQPKQPAITAREISSNTSIASQPRQISHISHPNQFKLADLSQQDYVPDHHDSAKEEENKQEDQSSGTPTTATFGGKLASKMKLMLRRKNTNAKKKEKKKRVYEEVDKIEAVHWTEM